MSRPEYMFIPFSLIPSQIMSTYNLHQLQHHDKIYIRINKGMYGLPQAGRLAHQQLITLLQPRGYYPCKHISGLWRHTTHNTSFELVVDYFGVNYIDRSHEQHLINTLQQHYQNIKVN